MTPRKPTKYQLSAGSGSYAVSGNAAGGKKLDGPTSRASKNQMLELTYDQHRTNPVGWYQCALGLHAAAKVLDQHQDEIPGDTRPFALNAALSLELIFKAILTKKQLQFPNDDGRHDLRALCRDAGVVVTSHQQTTLELMTEEIVWAGRYPIPNNRERYRNFHDQKFERHIIRGQTGNVFTAQANPKTFPTWDNYLRIWDLAVAELGLP